jgi:hypothetical protein
VTPFAGAASFGNVDRMAENGGAKTFNRIGNVTWFAGVTAGTIFFGSYTECLHAAMARSARFGFFHISHGEMFFVSQAENRIVTYPAVVVVFFQVEFVTEYNRISVFEIESDVLGFRRTGADNRQYADDNGE